MEMRKARTRTQLLKPLNLFRTIKRKVVIATFKEAVIRALFVYYTLSDLKKKGYRIYARKGGKEEEVIIV